MSWAVSDGTFHTQVGSFPRAPLPSWASALSSQAHDLGQIHSHGNVPSGSSSRVDVGPRALHGAHHAEHLEGVSGRSACHAPADQGDRLLFFKPDLSQSTRSSTGALPSLVPPPPPADSALARGCPVRSPLHHCPRVMLSQIPRSNEPESPAGPIHHGFMSAKEAAAGELVIRWGLGVQRSGPWSQDPRGVGSNPSPFTVGRVTLGTTCIHPLCTSPVTLTLGSYMDEMNNDS